MSNFACFFTFSRTTVRLPFQEGRNLEILVGARHPVTGVAGRSNKGVAAILFDGAMNQPEPPFRDILSFFS